MARFLSNNNITNSKLMEFALVACIIGISLISTILFFEYLDDRMEKKYKQLKEKQDGVHVNRD